MAKTQIWGNYATESITGTVGRKIFLHKFNRPLLKEVLTFLKVAKLLFQIFLSIISIAFTQLGTHIELIKFFCSCCRKNGAHDTRVRHTVICCKNWEMHTS